MSNQPLRDAHKVAKPDGSSFIALSGAVVYENTPGCTVTEIRGYDDPGGRGFVVVGPGRGVTR